MESESWYQMQGMRKIQALHAPRYHRLAGVRLIGLVGGKDCLGPSNPAAATILQRGKVGVCRIQRIRQIVVREPGARLDDSMESHSLWRPICPSQFISTVSMSLTERGIGQGSPAPSIMAPPVDGF